MTSASELGGAVRRACDERFSGVVSVSVGDTVEFEWSTGPAVRDAGVPNTVATQFALASGTKGFTALTAWSLIESGELRAERSVRSLLGDDLPQIPEDVTIAHLLEHTSGLSDYIDDEADEVVELRVPFAQLTDTEAYVATLVDVAPECAAGERFVYNNAGYVLLAVCLQRLCRQPFAEVVAERVCTPAGLSHTGFLRVDDLPAGAAVGYLDNGRPNTGSLPALGSGDGGIYSTAADLRRWWLALFAGRIVALSTLRELTSPRHDVPGNGIRFGAGLWLAATGMQVQIRGGDAGIGFLSSHDPVTGRTCTVLRNCDGPVLAIARAAGAAV